MDGVYHSPTHTNLPFPAPRSFYGPCHWDAQEWVGLQLEQPGAGSDATVDGLKYFDAPPGAALFVRAAMLKPVSGKAP